MNQISFFKKRPISSHGFIFLFLLILAFSLSFVKETKAAKDISIGSSGDNVILPNLLNCSSTGVTLKTDATGKLFCGTVTGGVTGSGATSSVARWTGPNTLGTGSLYDNGTSVGIGTTNPLTKLQINNQAAFNTVTPGLGYYGLHLNGQTTADYASGITWSGGSATGAQAGIYVQGSGAYGSKMYFATTNAYVTGAQTKMMIDHNGNVGIGSLSPITPFDVIGKFKITPGGIIYNTDNLRWLDFTATLGDSLKVYADIYTTNGRFKSDLTTGLNYMMGNLGIGTTTPSNLLHVVAKVTPTIDMVNISNAGFPVTAAGVSGLQIGYTGGAGAIEASAQRTDLTPGSTSGSIWNALRVTSGAAGAGVTLNGIKLEDKTVGTGTSVGLRIGTGWDYGIYSNTAGNNYFAGNVGIGTATPAYKLDVNGSIVARGTSDNTAPVVDAVKLDGLGLIGNRANLYITNSSASGLIQFGVGGVHNASPKMTILSSGNVGIGTTAPGTKLHVYQNTANDVVGQVENAYSGYAANLITIANSNYSAYRSIGTGQIWSTGQYGGANYTVKDVTGATIPFTIEQGAVTNALYIKNGGNVGIGTTTPASALDVNGLIKMRNFTITQPEDVVNKSYLDAALGDPVGAGTSGQTLRNDGTSWVANSVLYNSGTNVGVGTSAPVEKLDVAGGLVLGSGGMRFVSSGGINYIQSGEAYGVSSWRPIYFGPYGTAVGMKMVLDSSGNLGIGTTTPTSALDVNGLIKMRNFTITQPEDVVNKSYLDAALGDPVGAGTSGQTLRNNGTSWISNSTLYNNGTNVGIGTTNTSYKLNVAGTGLFSDTLRVDDAADTAGKSLLYLTGNDTNKWIGFDGHSLGIGPVGYAHSSINLGPQGSTSGETNSNVYVHWVNASLTRYNRWMINAYGSGGTITGYANNGATINTLINSMGDSYFNAGNVGIGTNSPNAKLAVRGNVLLGDDTGYTVSSSRTSGMFLKADTIDSQVAGDNLELQYGIAGNVVVYGADSNLIVQGTGNSSFAGNVGIGTTNPGAVLEVAGANGFRIQARSIDPAYYTTFTQRYSGGGLDIVTKEYGQPDTNLSFYRGNVGIGTASPVSTLDVRGTTPVITVGTTGSTGGALYFGNSNHGITRGYTANANDVGFYTSGGDLYLSANNTSASQFVLKNSGSVGIGTDNPGYKLDIAGTSHTTGISTLDSNLIFTQSASKRNIGMVGTYSPNSLAAIWSMGGGYQLTSTGGAGTLYGLSYSYEPDYGGAGNNPGAVIGLGHQMQWRNGGATQTAIGTGIYTIGSVGIGAAAGSYKLNVNGNTNITGTLNVTSDIFGKSFQYSDRRLKKNIATISSPLDKISKLRGVTFNWKKDNSPSVGLIAQEVETVFPELVRESEGIKTVQYSSLVAPLIEAVKEQQKEIQSLQNRLIILEKRSAK